ncbi:MAG: nucleotide exchange factor GrpE [Deltaproteobacteria bacterium]|nr:nucleotide exchange factor GrpE [Deltaproteobacteria bacterium]
MSKILEGHDKQVEWKEQVMSNFGSWLAELPDIPRDKNGTLDPCDLFTLLSEFTALRQEIKMQNREQSKTLSRFTSFIDAYRETSELFRQRSRELDALEEKIRLESEKKTVKLFLDLRDALVRGLSASTKAVKSKSFFRPPPKGIEEIEEGYKMAVRRFDRALSMIDIYVLQTVGHPFNPRTMRAVGKNTVEDMEKGIVLEEHVCGFIRNDELLRIAEVIVSA